MHTVIGPAIAFLTAFYLARRSNGFVHGALAGVIGAFTGVGVAMTIYMLL